MDAAIPDRSAMAVPVNPLAPGEEQHPWALGIGNSFILVCVTPEGKRPG